MNRHFACLLLVFPGCVCSGGGPALEDFVVEVPIRASEGGFIESADGQMTLVVPPDALASDRTLTVRPVNDDELPKALTDLGVEGPVYELGPSGTTFEYPAVVHWRLPADGEHVTNVQLMTWDPERGVTPLNRQREPWAVVHRADTGAWTSFEVTHFSMAFEMKGSLELGLTRVPVEMEIGTEFEATAVAVFPSPDLRFSVRPQMFGRNRGTVKQLSFKELPVSGTRYEGLGRYVCRAPGRGTYGFNIGYDIEFDPSHPTKRGWQGATIEVLSVYGLFMTRPIDIEGVARGIGTMEFDVRCVAPPEGNFTRRDCCRHYGAGCGFDSEGRCFGRVMTEPCNETNCRRRSEEDACCNDDEESGRCVQVDPRDPDACFGTLYPRKSCDEVGPCPTTVTREVDRALPGLANYFFWFLQDLYPDTRPDTERSDGKQSQPPEPEQELTGVMDPVLDLSEAAARTLFGERFACAESAVGLALCADAATDEAGQYIFLLGQFAAPVPLEGDRILQYAFVFDTDGDPSNDWVPLPAFPKDFFAGTDRWYEALYAPDDGWRLKVSDVVGGQPVEVSSGARVVFAGHQFAIFIPRDEIDPAVARFRVTAFSHTGDYGLQGGPWSGDYHPRLEQPLLPVAEMVLESQR